MPLYPCAILNHDQSEVLVWIRTTENEHVLSIVLSCVFSVTCEINQLIIRLLHYAAI